MMYLEKINIMPQGMYSILANQVSDTDLSINRDSVLSMKNSSHEFIGIKCLESKTMEVLDEPIYMDMSKDISCVSNSYEIFYDKIADGYFSNKSLFIKNEKIKPFFDLDKKEQESIFNDLKNKGFDTNRLLNKELLESPINKSINELVEENIYEEMNQHCPLKEKLELEEKLDFIDGLSKIICKNNNMNGKFKDELIKSMNEVSLKALFSLCEKYNELYEIQDDFSINRFIYRFIDGFNKSNNHKIEVNEDLKRCLNAFVLLESLRLKNNNII
ncbi:hypothetical protein [Proteus appendicitidis]|uniref:Uncharacterized protein n=1 Tax=Proteus appendicitidis TaxID=3034648 RepID=A0ABY8Y9R6_9GAMM|nr:hypothetical protein [Proteus sp. HZ0627]WIV89174.1 hypothetical protein QQS39_03935 [Proteus sp. HZ0627]